MSDCINLNMTLGAQYDVNIKKEEIYVGPYIELFTGTLSFLDDTNIPEGVVSLRDYLFYFSYGLSTVSSENIVSVGESTFYGSPLEYVHLPNLSSSGILSFAYTKIEEISFPELIIVSSQMFMGCENLVTADFSKVERIDRYAFYNCTNLENLILRTENGIPELYGDNIFYGTKIESGEGHIYVPRDAIREYKAYSGWSTYASQILPIEDEISE